MTVQLIYHYRPTKTDIRLPLGQDLTCYIARLLPWAGVAVFFHKPLKVPGKPFFLKADTFHATVILYSII
jgi:hypothetical protein